MADLAAAPQEGNRTEYTAIIGAILNVIAIGVEALLGIDIPADVWVAANTVIGSLLAVFLGRRVSRTEEAANQAVAASAKEPTK